MPTTLSAIDARVSDEADPDNANERRLVDVVRVDLSALAPSIASSRAGRELIALLRKICAGGTPTGGKHVSIALEARGGPVDVGDCLVGLLAVLEPRVKSLAIRATGAGIEGNPKACFYQAWPELLRGLAGLESLSLDGLPVNAELACVLAKNLPGLRTLRIGGAFTSRLVLETLAGRPRPMLEEISLAPAPAGTFDLAHAVVNAEFLSGKYAEKPPAGDGPLLPALKRLSVDPRAKLDLGLVGRFTNLERLAIPVAEGTPTSTIEGLARLQRLRALRLTLRSGAPELVASLARALEALPALAELHVALQVAPDARPELRARLESAVPPHATIVDEDGDPSEDEEGGDGQELSEQVRSRCKSQVSTLLVKSMNTFSKIKCAAFADDSEDEDEESEDEDEDEGDGGDGGETELSGGDLRRLLSALRRLTA